MKLSDLRVGDSGVVEAVDTQADPDLGWTLDQASLQATDPAQALRLARLGALVWRRLWTHAGT